MTLVEKGKEEIKISLYKENFSAVNFSRSLLRNAPHLSVVEVAENEKFWGMDT